MKLPETMRTELLKPVKERAWRLPAIANFILGGAGAGLYILDSLRLLFSAESAPVMHSGPIGLASAVMVGLGFFAVSLESGRPWRAMYLLSNLRGSWMSVEILSGALFMAAAMLDYVFSLPALRVAAVCAALELIISHGFILYRARAMTAWNVPAIPFLFFSSALVLGGGVLLALGGLQPSLNDDNFLRVVLVCLIADIVVWGLYVRLPRDSHFRKATAYLRRPFAMFSVTGLGHLLPLILLAWLALTSAEPDDAGIRHLVVALTGFCMLAGGVAQKIVVILGANFNRGVMMGEARVPPLICERSHPGKS